MNRPKNLKNYYNQLLSASNADSPSYDEKQLLKYNQWLIDHYGILIRDASNFRGLDHHCFRVTARTPEEDDQLVSAIKHYKEWKQQL